MRLNGTVLCLTVAWLWGCGNESDGLLAASTSTSQCLTTYYDPILRVGFNPPLGFEGHFINDMGAVEFMLADPVTPFAEQTSITLNVFPNHPEGLGESVQLWITTTSQSEFFEFLGQELFTASNGLSGYLLWWRFISTDGDPTFDFLFVEGWTAGEEVTLMVRAAASRYEFLLLEPVLEAAARSICAD